MRYVNLGNTGLKVSKICLGTMGFGNAEEWMIEMDEAKKITQRAIDLGVNFIDTANLYWAGRSEEIVGEAIKGYRDDICDLQRNSSSRSAPNRTTAASPDITSSARWREL